MYVLLTHRHIPLRNVSLPESNISDLFGQEKSLTQPCLFRGSTVCPFPGFGTSCNGLYSHDCVDSLKFFDQEARRHRL